MMWLLASAFFAAALRVVIGVYFLSRVLTGCGQFDVRGIVVVCLVSLSAFFMQWPNPMLVALEVLGMAFCAVRIQNLDGRMSLFFAICYEIALALWQFLFAAWLGVLFAEPRFLSLEMPEGQIALWTLQVVLLLLVFCEKRHPISTRQGAMRAITVFIVLALFAVISLTEQSRIDLPTDEINLWLIMTLVLMIAVLVFNMRRQLETEQALAELRAAQTESAEREYRRLSELYAANARLFHDMHNHLGVLRRLLAHGKNEEAVAYLDSLQAPLAESLGADWTGDETVDHLIAHKGAQAQAAGIAFVADAQFPRHTNLRSADLCAILGNLLDNAFEAAEKSEGERFMRLVMRRIGMMLVIKVENSALQPEADLSTTKKDDGLHGWGLASARAACARYDGVVQTSYDDGVFTAVAMLSFDAI